MSKILNILGGPGIGKSTAAARIFCKLKENGHSVEIVTEVAKDYVWEDHTSILKDQLYIFAKQNRRLERLRDKVDYVVTDSPGILSLAYQMPDYYPNFSNLVLDVHNSYENINLMLDRSHSFNPEGRAHDEIESKDIDNRIISILDQYGIKYHLVKSDDESLQQIINQILNGNI
jgi:KaiC/GvpD/RAD55 family RecA-like ATPase